MSHVLQYRTRISYLKSAFATMCSTFHAYFDSIDNHVDNIYISVYSITETDIFEYCRPTSVMCIVHKQFVETFRS